MSIFFNSFRSVVFLLCVHLNRPLPKYLHIRSSAVGLCIFTNNIHQKSSRGANMSGAIGQGFTNRQIQIIAVCTTCLTLSTLGIALRLLVRRIIATANLWWDDWVAILALVPLFMAFGCEER